jgi:hypothetical protein
MIAAAAAVAAVVVAAAAAAAAGVLVLSWRDMTAAGGSVMRTACGSPTCQV